MIFFLGGSKIGEKQRIWYPVYWGPLFWLYLVTFNFYLYCWALITVACFVSIVFLSPSLYISQKGVCWLTCKKKPNIVGGVFYLRVFLTIPSLNLHVWAPMFFGFLLKQQQWGIIGLVCFSFSWFLVGSRQSQPPHLLQVSISSRTLMFLLHLLTSLLQMFGFASTFNSAFIFIFSFLQKLLVELCPMWSLLLWSGCGHWSLPPIQVHILYWSHI